MDNLFKKMMSSGLKRGYRDNEDIYAEPIDLGKDKLNPIIS